MLMAMTEQISTSCLVLRPFVQAAMKAMEGAAAELPHKPDFLLVDGNRLPKARGSSAFSAVLLSVAGQLMAAGSCCPRQAHVCCSWWWSVLQCQLSR